MPTRLPLISIEVLKRHYDSTNHAGRFPCDLCYKPRTEFFFRIARRGKGRRNNVIKYWCEPCTVKYYLKQHAYVKLTGKIWDATDRPP